MSEKKNLQSHVNDDSRVEQEKSPAFRVVYSNLFNYRVTLTDISLIFSTLTDVGEAQNTLVQTQEVAVIMALGQAKSLAEYLTMVLSRYEREIGPINTIGKSPPSETEIDGMFKVLKDIGVH